MGTITTGDRDTPRRRRKADFLRITAAWQRGRGGQTSSKPGRTLSLSLLAALPPGEMKLKNKKRERERETWSRAQQRINFNFFQN